MKTFKISLAAIFGIAICIAIFFGIQKIKSPSTIPPVSNRYAEKIKKEIDILTTEPDTQFNKDSYREINYQINEFYKQNKFGTNQSENDQWKEILDKTLYSVYTEKFIKRTKLIFSGSEWDPNDLNFIKTEKNELKNSKFLEQDSPVNQEFSKIQEILDQYYQIVSFISSCQSFHFSGTSLSDRFPIGEVQNIINYKNELIQDNLGNEYVNNCTRLHTQLNEIPQLLFQAHVDYLDRKIAYWSDTYKQYHSQADYSNNLYKPLKNEIELLDNEIYNGEDIDREYNRLSQKWSSDNTKAYYYKY